MALGKFLEAYRKTHQLSITELAERLDYNQGNLSRLLHSNKKSITLASACRMAKNLGVTIDEMVAYEDDKRGD